jgi:uncharacterized protein
MKRLRNNLQRRLNRWLQWIWQQEGTPGQRARGLAAGVFCGCFPFFGFQTLLGIGLASVVRGNHLLAAAGTWISNPFTYVPLFWFNYRLGALLLGEGAGWPGLNTLNQELLATAGWDVMSRLLLGSGLTGMLLGVLTWRLARSWLQPERNKIKSWRN